MSKRRTHTREDSDDFRPGPAQAQKKEQRRKASAAYYARNPELREKNRLAMQLRRASIKAKKRQWDPPRRLARSKNAHNEKSRRSPTFASHEILDGSVHFLDVRGATESSLPNTAFQQQPALRPVTETSERNTRAQSISPTPDECAAAEVLATMADGHIGGSQDSVLRMANLLSSHEGGRLMSPPQSRYDQGARCRLHSGSDQTQ
ncbi:hypothetical protein B0H13DRAFT_2369752 [Mycena leptocephala]|nr:hypothetical protein B0H13DRAFT_2369752 [Mycena leptocephala]